MYKIAIIICISCFVMNAEQLDSLKTNIYASPKTTEATSSKDTTLHCKEEKPAMELGGYVTLDYEAKTSETRNGKLFLRWVQLGANVNISEEVIASVAILASKKMDSLSIYQAVASYKPTGTELQVLFGQQTFNHGLLTTRMISDPLIINDAMLTYPGLSCNYTIGRFTPSVAFAVLSSQDTLLQTSSSNYAGIVGLDMSLPSGSLARLSSLVSQEFTDIDLALSYTIWKLSLDGEIYSKVRGAEKEKTSGYYAGILFNATDRVGIALRHDAYSSDMFHNMENRTAAGVVFSIKDGVFWATEISQVTPVGDKPYAVIQMQIGLKQTLGLPGFQRKTLTRE